VPRFYFHLKTGETVIEDQDGSELADFEAAREEALTGARELWAEAIKSGSDLQAEAFVIADEDGREVMSLPLVEALPERLRRRE
jgi:hypothetical protein